MLMPKVSFIIPTLNRERTIEACLKSIAAQTYPNKEIIVVDGCSRDKTLNIVSKYATKIVSESGTLGQARQIGVENSTGDILGIFDSDIVLPAKDWTEKAIQYFKNNNDVAVVWPFNKAPLGASIVTQCYFSLWNSRASEFMKKENKKILIPGGNSFFLRKAFEQTGGFDRSLKFGEDLDLGNRIIKLGYKVAIFKEPIIHDTMWSLREFTRKQFWGATSLATADMSIVSLCLNWHDDTTDEKKVPFGLSAIRFIVNGVFSMGIGLGKNRDKSWLIFPLLMVIRTTIYGRFLLKRLIRS
jgi:glycosyltransferase involved in cell wall biosynthesis